MNATHNVKVGALFSMSWGYGQTNVNYFQVTRVTAKGVFVREIGSKSVPGSQGMMCENVVPAKDQFLLQSQWCDNLRSEHGQIVHGNIETFRKIQFSGHQDGCKPYFNFRGRYFARPVKEGEATYSSWYA